MNDCAQISFYFDPVCPWCWITARWLIDVRSQRPMDIEWRSFSLAIKNKDLDVPDRWRQVELKGLRALRVIEAVRAGGIGSIESIYAEMGRRWHHDRERSFNLPDILAAVDIDPAFADAADDQAWDDAIDDSMDDALSVVGDDVGVPTVILDGSVGFYGPIVAPAPTGDAAVELYDHLVAIARVPGFFEMKRTRDTGPLFGDRP